ncbi:hypothetical protein HYS00_03015 [Candidatus Microgenomates bacterium]|nr:hypothetical protein [Candidatus Microgenomates bacterium]
MRTELEASLGDHSIYHARRSEFDTGERIPFRVSPRPLELSASQKKELAGIGADTTAYYMAVDRLYRSDERVRDLLDTGKPEMFTGDHAAQYLFIRPDLIITPQGFSLCEVETSPFGLALAEVLNHGYSSVGFDTLVDTATLPEYVHANTPVDGRIIYSTKTQAYAGQMSFLAEQVFSGPGRNWQAYSTNEPCDTDSSPIYRGFYLSEALTDPNVRLLLDNQMQQGQPLLPSPTPHLEEKANLAFIWDRRFDAYFKKELGPGAVTHLRHVIPPSWIVGQEEFFMPGLPDGISSSVGLATLAKSKRAFVLKHSGFGEHSSWAEGVTFLHDKSVMNAQSALIDSHRDTSALHIIQEFKKGMKVPMQYIDLDGAYTDMMAKVRLTPYYSFVPGQEGKLIAVKATGCENTDFIHASSTSINTAVS